MANRMLSFAFFLPHTCQQLHEYLGYSGSIVGTIKAVTLQEKTRTHLALRCDATSLQGTWTPSELAPGQLLRKPSPLFKKLDEEIIDQETERMMAS